MSNSFRVSGIFLAVAGAALLAASYFQTGLGPLTAGGMSALILGFTGIVLAKTASRPSSEVQRTFWKLLLTGIMVFWVIDVILFFLGQRDIILYFSVNAIVYLIIVPVYLSYNPRARSPLTRIGTVILITFLAIMIFKIWEVIK